DNSLGVSTAVVEPYNSVLCTHALLKHTDVSALLDNEFIDTSFVLRVAALRLTWVHGMTVKSRRWSRNIFVLTYMIAYPEKIEDDNKDHICYHVVDKCIASSLVIPPKETVVIREDCVLRFTQKELVKAPGMLLWHKNS
ncbi:hypothetical protein M8C21_032879, partial [Ambrosia artemisiifolia]